MKYVLIIRMSITPTVFDFEFRTGISKKPKYPFCIIIYKAKTKQFNDLFLQSIVR